MSKRKEGPTPGKRRARRGKMLVRRVVKVAAPVPGKHHLNFLKRLGEKRKKAARYFARLRRRRNRR